MWPIRWAAPAAGRDIPRALAAPTRARGSIAAGPRGTAFDFGFPVAGDPQDANARRAALSPLLGDDEYRPLASTVRVEIGARSHAGHAREQNEDHYLIVRLEREQETLASSLPSADLPGHYKEYGYAMVVADGLGDSGSGAVASRVALSSLAHLAIHYGRWNVRVDPHTATEIKERAEWFYHRADDAVVLRSRGHAVLTGMATTMTAAYSAGDDLFIAHVGHSRAYLFRHGALTQLTRDHTVSWAAGEAGRLTAVDRGTRDLRHILTDTIGGHVSAPAVDVDHLRLLNGDMIMLCTNGLTDMVADDRLAGVLTERRAPRDQCDMCVDLALRAGGQDNVTVVIAQYHIPAE